MQHETLRAAILGSDLILAALPAEPVQVVNACLALGYDFVVPASWGDELIANGVLEELAQRPPGTTILCSCPNARRRILSAGSELTPFLVQTVAPPVAAARYLRALNGESNLRITYVGSCPDAEDESISERITPAEFFELCDNYDVSITEQPTVFESFMPTDRRRCLSLPGGLPTSESVRAVQQLTDIIAIDSDAVAFEVTQYVISGRPALLDLSAAVGCACSGFVAGREATARHGRETLVALEPPRAPSPVIDLRIPVDLELPGQTPVPSLYEESIPLSVVVGADLSNSDNAPLGDSATGVDLSWGESSFDFDDVRADAVPLTGSASASGGVRHADTAGLSQSGEGPTQAERRSAVGRDEIRAPRTRGPGGTPTGAPAIQTPAGPLPRAYMMMKRIKASGEHPAVTRRETPQVQNVVPRSPTPVRTNTQVPEKESAGAASRERRESKGHASASGGRGPVENVLDILTKAIRDVVEPR